MRAKGPWRFLRPLARARLLWQKSEAVLEKAVLEKAVLEKAVLESLLNSPSLLSGVTF